MSIQEKFSFRNRLPGKRSEIPEFIPELPKVENLTEKKPGEDQVKRDSTQEEISENNK